MRRLTEWWLGMERVKEVLRLWELGANKTEIAQAVGTTRFTVRDYLSRAKAAGLTYRAAAELGAAELRAPLREGSAGPPGQGHRGMDYLHIQKEMTRKSVTLLLLWEEYLRERPDGYSYAQFCKRYQLWPKATSSRCGGTTGPARSCLSTTPA